MDEWMNEWEMDEMKDGSNDIPVFDEHLHDSLIERWNL